MQGGKYVELNALRAGLVVDPADWRWTSYHHYANGQFDLLITDDPFYEELGSSASKRQQAYRELLVDDLVTHNYRSPVWGAAQQRYAERQKVARKILKAKSSG